MKLKCSDGQVRHFKPSQNTPNGVAEARCLECWEGLGANDLPIVKPRMIPAPELEELADDLIDRYPNDFEHLHGARIVYLWKEKGGESSGYAVLGKCIRPTGLADYFASDQGNEFSKVDFVVWCAADHLMINQANRRTVYALLFHELKHTSIVDGKYVVVGHESSSCIREQISVNSWANAIRHLPFKILWSSSVSSPWPSS